LALPPLLLLFAAAPERPAGAKWKGVIKMHDRIDAQLWADHGSQFAGDIAKALKWVLRTFCVMTAIQYRAPWREESSKAC
jgi:hypothetical protein